LEEGVSVGAFTEIKNSIMGSNTTIHSGFVGDSVIGQDCKIGSGFTTANTKINRGNIETEVKGSKVDTGVSRFGVIIGHNVKIGIKVSTMPGVIIGNNSLIGPSTSVFKNVPSDSKYYTKFQEIVEKN
jgi:bifunctional UDP-N-acetylglucosamine pyrophosphorylase/glucosamine-1-phosphate N-acetyltransferase